MGGLCQARVEMTNKTITTLPALRDALRQVYVDTDWQRLSNSQPMLVPMLEVQGEITRTVEKIEKLIDRGEKS